ncbi:MAG: nitrite reductase (NAD(P)H), partial [Pseudomonadota bacterium]
MKKPSLVVIGNGMVGHHFVDQFIAAGGLDTYCVQVFGEESRAAYDRVHLSEYVDGRSEADLRMPGADDYAAHGVVFESDSAVQGLDLSAKTVTLQSG